MIFQTVPDAKSQKGPVRDLFVYRSSGTPLRIPGSARAPAALCAGVGREGITAFRDRNDKQVTGDDLVSLQAVDLAQH